MTFSIAGRAIGPGHPVYVVAELSGNHGQRYEYAAQLVRAAAEAGADAVKLQLYDPGTITLDCVSQPFRIDYGVKPWAGRTLHDLYALNCTPWKWYPSLAKLAAELGMHCFASVFDHAAVGFLEAYSAPAYKISSFELVDIPLIRKVRATGKPVIISTGMSTLREVDEALMAAGWIVDAEIALLVCTSAYPSVAADARLWRIPYLAQRGYDVPVGLSDHSIDLVVPLAAVALGASIVEKHLCLSRGAAGADAKFSVEPRELATLVQAVRRVEAAVSGGTWGSTLVEKASLRLRRSLFVVRDMAPGDAFTEDNVKSIRPAGGLHTRHLDGVLGQHANHAISRGTPLSWELIL